MEERRGGIGFAGAKFLLAGLAGSPNALLAEVGVGDFLAAVVEAAGEAVEEDEGLFNEAERGTTSFFGGSLFQPEKRSINFRNQLILVVTIFFRIFFFKLLSGSRENKYS